MSKSRIYLSIASLLVLMAAPAARAEFPPPQIDIGVQFIDITLGDYSNFELDGLGVTARGLCGNAFLNDNPTTSRLGDWRTALSGTIGTVDSDVEYASAGVDLVLTPTITSGNTIKLSLSVGLKADYLGEAEDRQEIGQDPFNGQPIVSELKTDSLSTVGLIGGLLLEVDGKMVDKVPFLGDIPVVGGLFRSQSFDDDKEELLIFISARITGSDEGN